MLQLLIALQLLQVALLWTHDWVPLGPLNDVQAVRREESPVRLALVTLVQSLPFTVGLAASVWMLADGRPAWLWRWLWISYGVLFFGELRAWWWPYLFGAEPQRAARYQRMFGATHAFLPERGGIVPNTLHCVLHLATAATLAALLLDHRPV